MLQYSTRVELEEQAGLINHDEIYALMVFSNGEWYFYMNEDGTFRGDVEILDLIHPIEEAYMSCHERSYEGSMSAYINWISFRYKVIKTRTSELKNLIHDTTIHKCRNISGGFLGVKLKPEMYHIMEKGAEPKLIVYDDGEGEHYEMGK